MSEKETREINFWHVALSTDQWQRIACLCKSGHLWLNETPFDVIYKDDILVFSDEKNPFARCICKVLSSHWYPGFKAAFSSVNVGTLGYTRGEKIAASYHDFADDYSLNQVRAHGVVAVVWKLLSCEYIKYTDDADPRKVKPRKESDFDPEADWEAPKDVDDMLPEMSPEEEAHPVVSVGKELAEHVPKVEPEEMTEPVDVVNLPLSDEGGDKANGAAVEGAIA